MTKEKGKQMGKNTVKKIIACMVLVFVMCGYGMLDGYAADTSECTTYGGSNIGDQDYYTWSDTVKSYLVYQNGRYMRFQANAVRSGYLVEYYDKNFKLLSRRAVNKELDMFGGFCQSGDYYYVLSGQTNYDESDNVEVYRITKYDKNWNRISSCGLKGANTYIPFDAGSARMTSSGRYLMIRTCHEMYKKSDGYHHQANVTIQVDMQTMKVIDSFTDVMNTEYGYVSHSFNQFIHMENGRIVAVDHGDAYPRSIVLIKYPSAIGSDGFHEWNCEATDVISFDGETGDNYTGATVGGFEMSSSSYLIAGSRDIGDGATYGRDIYVASVSRSSGSVKVNNITNYSDGYSETPHLVKTGSDSFVLIWGRDSKVYYTKIAGSGRRVGDVYSMEGDLSDCEPVMANDRITWYTWKNNEIAFYQINSGRLSSHSVKKVTSDHSFVIKGCDTKSGKVDLRCSKCGESKSIYTMTDFTTYWRKSDDSGAYSTEYDAAFRKGQVLPFTVSYDLSDDAYNNTLDISMIYKSSDPGIIEIAESETGQPELKFLRNGIATVTMYPTYNPALKKSYTLQVGPTGSVTMSAVNNTSAGISVKWKKTAGVKGYIVYRQSVGTKKWTRVKRISNARTVSYVDTAVKNNQGRKYTYKVAAYITLNGSDKEAAVSRGVSIARLCTPSVKAANVKGRKLKASWKKMTGVTRWQMQYASNKTFAKGKIVTCSSKTVAKTVGSLKKGRTYYVRLRSCSNYGGKTRYSGWSKIVKVKINK